MKLSKSLKNSLKLPTEQKLKQNDFVFGHFRLDFFLALFFLFSTIIQINDTDLFCLLLFSYPFKDIYSHDFI